MWLTHSNGRYEKCALCSHVGPTRTMAAHREGHGKQSVCEVCGKEVAKTSQGTHWQNMHKEFQCPDCGEIIYGNRLYRRHRDRVHHEPFQCDQGPCRNQKPPFPAKPTFPSISSLAVVFDCTEDESSFYI